jgi:hypothetical protein
MMLGLVPVSTRDYGDYDYSELNPPTMRQSMTVVMPATDRMHCHRNPMVVPATDRMHRHRNP